MKGKSVVIVAVMVFVFWTVSMFQGMRDEFYPAYNNLCQAEVALRQVRSEMATLKEQNESILNRLEALEDSARVIERTNTQKEAGR